MARLWVGDPAENGDLSQRGYTIVDPQPEEGIFARRPPRGLLHATGSRVAPGSERLLLAGDVTAVPAITSWIDLLPSEVAVAGEDHSLLPLPEPARPHCGMGRSGPEPRLTSRALDA